MSRQHFVYGLTNKSHSVLYTGVTNDLARRVWQHRHPNEESFTSRYRVRILVYFEVSHDSYNAIAREKQIKAGSRRKKILLIEKTNPGWRDLAKDLGLLE